LFTPLSMSLRSLRQTGLIICIVLNMVIIGVWHGFTLNYLVFGLLHGFFLSVTVLVLLALRARRGGAGSGGASGDRTGARLLEATTTGAGRLLTFGLMSFTQIFFHSQTWDQAVSILKQVLGLAPSGSQTILSLGSGVAVSVLVCAAIAVFDGSGSPGARWAGARLDRLAPQWLQYGACIFLLATLSGAQGGKFIYGQF